MCESAQECWRLVSVKLQLTLRILAIVDVSAWAGTFCASPRRGRVSTAVKAVSVQIASAWSAAIHTARRVELNKTVIKNHVTCVGAAVR